MLRRFAALLMVAFAVGLGPEGGTFPDWASLRVPPSLEAVRASLEKSAAKVPIWKDVQPKVMPYMEPVARAAEKLVPAPLKKLRGAPKAVNSTSEDVLRPSMDERRAPVTVAPTKASTIGPVDSGNAGDEVGVDPVVLPPSEESDVLATPYSPHIPDLTVPDAPGIPDLVTPDAQGIPDLVKPEAPDIPDLATPDAAGNPDLATPDARDMPDVPNIIINRDRNDTVFTFRFQYRLRQPKARHSTAAP